MELIQEYVENNFVKILKLYSFPMCYLGMDEPYQPWLNCCTLL